MSAIDPLISTTSPDSRPVRKDRSTGDTSPELPKDEMIRSLEDENRHLRADLEEMKKKLDQKEAIPGGRLEYDLGRNLLKLEGISTKDYTVDRLEVLLPDGDNLEERLMSSFKLNGEGMTMPESLLIALKNTPLEIQKARISIPAETMTRMLLESRQEALKKEGIKNVGIELEEGDRLVLSGWAKKLVPVPFSIKGELSITDDGRVRYHVKKMSAGLLPVPKIIQGIIMAIADKTMTDTTIERRGDEYIIDPGAFIPPNIRVKLTGVATEKDRLILAADSPPGQAPAKKAAAPVPKTLQCE